MFSPISSIESSPMNSPGRVALESAKNIKDVAIFRIPSGPAKRKRIKVLDEETYVEKLGEIIQRDFFPDLEKLQAQNEYLEAMNNNDTKRMRELYQKYSLERPRTERLASPATFDTPEHGQNSVSDTPMSSISNKTSNESKPQIKKESLDEFLCKTTSEDNASFEDIVIENQKKHRLRHAWLYKTETDTKLEAIENSKDQPLAIESGQRKKPLAIDTWGYKNKNYIMYIPDGVELTTEEKIELAKKKQEVVHSNTRLKVNPFNEQQNKETINEIAKMQSKANDGKIGIDGKEIVRDETPKVNGYSLMPSPSPTLVEDVLDSPIMTWGQIEGTPFRLDGGDTPLVHANQGPSFRMAEPPKREKLALQLVEKAGERNRDKKIKALNAARRSLATPSPRSTIDRLNTMSPAARRLATQKLRISVSPSPRSILSTTPSMRIKTPSTPRLNTPSVKSTRSDLISKSQTPILTDNLLKLPQRQRASDFFNS